MKALIIAALSFSVLTPHAADYALEDRKLAEYFEQRTRAIEKRWEGKFQTLEDWEKARPELKRQLLEMLGLDPMPERTDLKTQITGTIDKPEYTVEKLNFQSLPGLYVTGNLYVPKKRDGKLPGILYVCGHSNMTTNGISLGNKAGYEHHGSWFARNGYVCLTIDTVQLGEIPGIHHGTYREGMWWWNSRGYTPAGVEAWNSMRAIDYLQSRPEVDPDKIGITGRSGGGAYSWYTAAIDDRVKVAAPVAGITDLRNHVVDGVVEGHCDCMYFVNTYQWDYWLLASMLAPRPLLICNTDKDTIFPLDGVVRVHTNTAHIYKLYKQPDNLGLVITEGPHKDTQELQVPVFRWFNRFLKKQEPFITIAATKEIAPMDLRVFNQLPQDSKNYRIHDTFVAPAKEPQLTTDEAWAKFKKETRAFLDDKVFAGWPENFSSERSVPVLGTETEGRELRWIETEPGFTISATVWKAEPGSDKVRIHVSVDDLQQAPDRSVNTIHLKTRPSVEQFADPKKHNQVQVRRRYMLLGGTVDSMRVWDIRAASRKAAELTGVQNPTITLAGEGLHGVNCLYAALYEPSVKELELSNLPRTQAEGPDYLNILRHIDLPTALALLAQEKTLTLKNCDPQLIEKVRKKLTGAAAKNFKTE